MSQKLNHAKSPSPEPQNSTLSSTSAAHLDCGCVNRFGGFPSEWMKRVDGEVVVVYGRLCEEHFHAYRASPSKRQTNKEKYSPIRASLVTFFTENPGLYTTAFLASELRYAQDAVRKQLYNLTKDKFIVEVIPPIGGVRCWRNASLAISKRTDTVQSRNRPQTWFSCLPDN